MNNWNAGEQVGARAVYIKHRLREGARKRYERTRITITQITRRGHDRLFSVSGRSGSSTPPVAVMVIRRLREGKGRRELQENTAWAPRVRVSLTRGKNALTIIKSACEYECACASACNAHAPTYRLYRGRIK